MSVKYIKKRFLGPEASFLLPNKEIYPMILPMAIPSLILLEETSKELGLWLVSGEHTHDSLIYMSHNSPSEITAEEIKTFYYVC